MSPWPPDEPGVEYDDGGMPVHFPMPVTATGEGPADVADTVRVVCWCHDPTCTREWDDMRGTPDTPGWAAFRERL